MTPLTAPNAQYATKQITLSWDGIARPHTHRYGKICPMSGHEVSLETNVILEEQ